MSFCRLSTTKKLIHQKGMAVASVEMMLCRMDIYEGTPRNRLPLCFQKWISSWPYSRIRIRSWLIFESRCVFGTVGYGTRSLKIIIGLMRFSFFRFFSYRFKVDGRLFNLKKEVSVQDSKHRKTLAEVS